MNLGIIKPVHIEDEMRNSYLDYAMSVIVSRALPDVRDGLKPAHRRILYAMLDMGIVHNSAHKKCARIVGEVLGKYHPHGDLAVYDTLVRMAQPFSMRYLLVDGQGNFGSVDDDPAAAMRYTEARLTAIAEEMLADINKDTVDFVPNFDDSLTEPSVLPSRIPNLLINGSSGIAVGMATNIPPHNLTEVLDAITFVIDNPEATIDELSGIIKGPDFPTAGIIMGRSELRNAYATGHGKVVVRAKTEITDDERKIIITELPYQVNKAALVQKIAELVKDKKISGISELRDESDRQGIRVVIELKRDSQADLVLNQLYKFTTMQSAFYINMLALVDNQPKVISLKEALQYFIDFRVDVITRRSRFELKEAQARAHILDGLKIALDHIDAVIKTIRESDNAEAARRNLMEKFKLSQLQAQAILDMQLRRLAHLERNKILEELAEILKKINYLEELLANPKRILMLIKEDAAELKQQYGDERRTVISEDEAIIPSDEELIPHVRVVMTLSNRGFVKRTPAAVYKTQHRGGKGVIGMTTREADAVRILVVSDTHDNLLFFTNRGKVFQLKCYEIPSDSSRTAKGTAVINLFPVSENEKVTAVVPLTQFENNFLIMATRRGEVKKTSASNFASVRRNGIIAMDLEEKDELVSACVASEESDVLMVTRKGFSIRFSVASLRTSSRTSGGVRGIRLQPEDVVVGMEVPHLDGYLLSITTGGYGKLTPFSSYPKQGRAGHGVRTFRISEKTGDVSAAEQVFLTQQLMIITADGNVMVTPIKEDGKGIPIYSRVTKGVHLMRPQPGDPVVSVAAFE